MDAFIQSLIRLMDIANEVGVPLVRAGFPIYDRFCYQKKPIVG